jgi:hypothetical protein
VINDNREPMGYETHSAGLPRTAPVSGQVEDTFRQRVDALPVSTRRLLQLAAGRAGTGQWHCAPADASPACPAR